MYSLALIIDIGFKISDLEKFGVFFLNKKFKLYILDISDLSDAKFKSDDIGNNVNYLKIKNKEELEKFLHISRLDYAFDFVSNYNLNLYIKDLSNSYRFKLVYWQNHYVMSIKKTFLEKILNILFTFIDTKRILFKLKFYFFSKKNKNFIYPVIISCGLDGLNSKYINKKTKIIKAHSNEYEEFLKKKIFLKNNNNNFSVFLDQNLPFHTDAIKIKKFNPKVTKKKYYPALNNFFNYFENLTNTKVLIAAHPKSSYETLNYWGERPYFKNKTLELINDCKYVLAHQSTSISYAVILMKKLIFLTSNEYIRSYDNFTVHGYSRFFNAPLFNIDNINKKTFNKEFKKKIDHKKYNQYFDRFIKHPQKKNTTKSLWEIFVDEIYKN